MALTSLASFSRVLCVIVLVAKGTSTFPSSPNQSSSKEEFDLERIQSEAEEFYKTLPATVVDDASLTVPELIEKYGYRCETHKVTTLDGYILTMHRIPFRHKMKYKKKPVVYLQHGLLSSSADWVILGPGRALPYILSDAGFDVWLANNRGNKYSRNHVSWDPKEADFWDFSWHEIAIYDEPSMIDYILNRTAQKQLYYIGHSQGTTVFYVMCSELPEYNKKIKAHFSLAPIGYMNHITSPLMQISSVGEMGLGQLLYDSGIREALPNYKFLPKVGKILCRDSSATQVLCTNWLFVLSGFNPKEMNASLLPTIMGHSPAGASTKQIAHYSQEINSGKFCQYDYGVIKNAFKYGKTDPPRYLMQKVTAPVYLLYSRNDWMANEVDVLRLYMELANVKEKILIEDEEFNHLDYLFAIHAREILYDKLVTLIKQIEGTGKSN